MADGRNKPSPRRKLSVKQVESMRLLRHYGWRIDALAERFGISPSQAWLICETDQVYKDVPRG